MTQAIIGFSGYVGSTLLKQTSFEAQYRSTNINEISRRTFDVVICAGAPAQKWIANREPELDLQKIEGLIMYLDSITCKKFILISTVDIFKHPIRVDEDTLVDEDDLHPYGLNRRLLEKFVETRFPDHLIVRLPGLVGPGLNKNVIYDFLNSNNLHLIDSRSEFQFYPMVNLWHDIQIALDANLNIIHLTSAPLSVAEVSLLGFGRPFRQILNSPPVKYDMLTKYTDIFGVQGKYLYSVRESIQAILTYAQSEPIKITTPSCLKI